MVVQHNLTAMNSNRMLGLTTKTQAKATEKLSSGYKINRAADDAAGLAISEKMRKQIRGLTQASANAQDGISAVQTAEGALTEVHDMLQRMNELAVKAANGTQSKSDRQAIQSEINQLVTEIDRVSITTKFNETYLLKGNNNGDVGKLTYSGGFSDSVYSRNNNDERIFVFGLWILFEDLDHNISQLVFDVLGLSDVFFIYDFTKPRHYGVSRARSDIRRQKNHFELVVKVVVKHAARKELVQFITDCVFRAFQSLFDFAENTHYSVS